MQRLFLLLISAVLVITACQPANTKGETSEETGTDTTVVTIEKLWETDTLLTTSESVVFDADRGVYYVSCIGGTPPWVNDGDGFIAKMGTSGEILEQKWVTGLNGPKGMGLVDSILYVNDNDRLVAIDIIKGEIIKKMPLGESTHLNDIAVGKDGAIYVSDSEKSIAYKVYGDDVEVLVQDTLIGGLNGVYYNGDELLFAGFDSGKLFTFDENNGKLTEVSDSMAGGDGIEKYGSGFFVSSWHGELYYLDGNWHRTKLLDTKADGINAADIEVVADKNLLLVPTFFDNRVVAYRVSL